MKLLDGKVDQGCGFEIFRKGKLDTCGQPAKYQRGHTYLCEECAGYVQAVRPEPLEVKGRVAIGRKL
jgi:hypothetical protein